MLPFSRDSKNIRNQFAYLNGLVMLDLSKAFDLVNHNLILKKLEIHGLSVREHSGPPSFYHVYE